MCDHCVTLKLAIQKGQRLEKTGFDPETTKRISVFVETLMEELAALETDHAVNGEHLAKGTQSFSD